MMSITITTIIPSVVDGAVIVVVVVVIVETTHIITADLNVRITDSYTG